MNVVFEARSEPEWKDENLLAAAAASDDSPAALPVVRRCAGYTQGASASPGWDYSVVLLRAVPVAVAQQDAGQAAPKRCAQG